MKEVIICLFTIFLLTNCNSTKEADQHCIENPDPDCACFMVYEPVCGCNDITYGNACEAECAGIIDYFTGPCPD